MGEILDFKPKKKTTRKERAALLLELLIPYIRTHGNERSVGGFKVIDAEKHKFEGMAR